MILQDRDKNILTALAKYGVLSTKQIAVLFFRGINHTTVMKRLRMLESENMILRSSGLPNAMSAWSLSINGSRLIGTDEPSRYVNRNTLLHEVSISELRISLETIGLGNDWTSEAELKKQISFDYRAHDRTARNIPDGLFVAKSNVIGVVAVELEFHAKNHQRYKKILSQYAEKDSIKWLWYVVKSQAIGDTVMGQWLKIQRYSYSPMLMISLLEDVLSIPRDANLYFYDGKKYRLENYFCLPKRLTASVLSGAQTAQGVSKLNQNPLSSLEVKISNEDQQVASAPNLKIAAPFALDPSPTTMRMGEGSRPTGGKEVSGAEDIGGGNE